MNKKTLLDVENSLSKTYRKDLFKPFVKAINTYNLLEEGDCVAICMSGGKDSLLLAKLFQELKKHNKFSFEIKFIAMDPGFSQEKLEQFIKNCQFLGIPINIRKSDIFKVTEKLSSDKPCYLCARMRRGFLYNFAKELGCNKIALGHHFNDVIETTLLSILYGGQFKTMVPKIKAKNFENMTLIRPMFLIKEYDIKRFIKKSELECMDCGCSVTKRQVESKRLEIKKLIEQLKLTNVDADNSIFKCAENINLNTVLGYTKNGITTTFNDIFEDNNEDDII